MYLVGFGVVLIIINVKKLTIAVGVRFCVLF